MNPPSYDLIVIGGGPAGTTGANTAAVFGKRVALVEKEVVIGGAGINTGTMPSKTLRETAIALSGWRSRKLFGVDLSLRREATIKEFTHHSDVVVEGERDEINTKLTHHGVTRLTGTASFVDPHTIRVLKQDGSETFLQGETILIATGSSPHRPPEFPFEDPRVHDSDELLHLKTLPKRLVIVGAGVIGAEYACTFDSMGSEVHLVDGRDILLGFLDDEVSEGLQAAMIANGVKFHWNQRVTHCDTSQRNGAELGDLILTMTSGEKIACDGLLVCAGRSSNSGKLNLAAAGITPGERGLIPVNEHFRTPVPHIYAAGDVIGPPALAATSMQQARIAMSHAYGLLLRLEQAPLLVTGIYTIPEASMVGETEESLKKKNIEYVIGRARYEDNPRGRIMGDEAGFLKLLFRKEDMRLLGVHILGELATEVVHIGLMALLAEANADVFDRACFNYPTLGDLYKAAAYDAILQRAAIAH